MEEDGGVHVRGRRAAYWLESVAMISHSANEALLPTSVKRVNAPKPAKRRFV
jgi:hypothetical protein